MSRKAGFRAGVLGVALTVALALTAVAVAAGGGTAPRLLSPNRKHIAPGHIRLVVEVPFKPVRAGVFIAVSRSRKLDRYGHLKECTNAQNGCDVETLSHWKGHEYSYVTQFETPGYWAVTPGKYYWQASYDSDNPLGIYYSRIGSFVVK